MSKSAEVAIDPTELGQPESPRRVTFEDSRDGTNHDPEYDQHGEVAASAEQNLVTLPEGVTFTDNSGRTMAEVARSRLDQSDRFARRVHRHRGDKEPKPSVVEAAEAGLDKTIRRGTFQEARHPKTGKMQFERVHETRDGQICEVMERKYTKQLLQSSQGGGKERFVENQPYHRVKALWAATGKRGNRIGYLVRPTRPAAKPKSK